MDKICSPAPHLKDLVPYDPKYMRVDMMMSANENALDVNEDIRKQIERAIRKVEFNRYPDPLANNLRDMIAEANGLERDWVLIGNGGDELLFNTALAWGGPGRKYLDLPPSFSPYINNAKLTNTEIVSIPRKIDRDFAIDELAVFSRLAKTGADRIDYTIIASPNNPTGLLAPTGFISGVLDVTDALVLVDEAYFEFSRSTVRPMLEDNENLVILRTFSKAFSIAGVRLGYILAHPSVIKEYLKVRQPYSVDVVSQAIGEVVYANRARFEPGINNIIEEREWLIKKMRTIPGVKPYPSDSNWVLFSMEDAHEAWEYLLDKGILIRDFSDNPMLPDMLRVSVGTQEQNRAFVSGLRDFAMRPR